MIYIISFDDNFHGSALVESKKPYKEVENLVYSCLCKINDVDECTMLTSEEIAEVLIHIKGISRPRHALLYKPHAVINTYDLWESRCGQKIDGIYVYDYILNRFSKRKNNRRALNLITKLVRETRKILEERENNA